MTEREHPNTQYEPREPYTPDGHVEWEAGNIEDEGGEYDKYLTRDYRAERESLDYRMY